VNYSIGIDLGGTNIKALAVAEDGRILDQAQCPTHDTDKLWPEKIRNLCSSLQDSRGTPANAIGLAAPGLASSDGRSIAFMPGRLQGLENLDWTAHLNSARVIPVLNDAHAALLGEIWLGAGRGCRNAIMLTLGTGVGGAIYADGRLLKGHIGRAGHLGHLCLDPSGPRDITGIPGSLEDAIGECTLASRASGRFSSTQALLGDVIAGDGDAQYIWGRSVHALACGVASLINILDPEAVIIGGGIAKAEAALFEPLRKELDEIEWRPGGHRARIVPAELGDVAGALGAAWNAMKSIDPCGE